MSDIDQDETKINNEDPGNVFNHATKHILRQAFWFNKLTNTYHCSLVQMEYTLMGIRFDVYGVNSSYKFFVEVGHVAPKKKMWLIDYVGKHKNCVFVHDQSTEYDGLVEVHRDGKILKTI